MSSRPICFASRTGRARALRAFLPLLCCLALCLPPENAAAADLYRARDAVGTSWNTDTGWATTSGGSGSQTRTGAGDTVRLDNGVPARALILNDNAEAGALTITAGGWSVGGDGTLTVTGTTTVGTGGRFIITNGATLTGAGGIQVGTGSGGANSARLRIAGAGEERLSTLTGGFLHVQSDGNYSDDANSVVNLTGNANFEINTRISSKSFTSGGLTTANGANLTLGAGAQVNAGGNNGEGDIVIDGNLNLSTDYDPHVGRYLGGRNLTVNGGYTDAANSDVSLTGNADFKNSTIISSALFDSVGLSTATGKNLTLATGARVNAGSGDINVGRHLNLAGGANSLSGNNLSLGGLYSDNSTSTVTLGGAANFTDTSDAHAIQGTFSSKGMTVGTDAVVDASNAAGFTSNGGDLILQAGSGNPGSGPADGVTTLNAGGKDLTYDDLNLENNTGLAARDILVTGKADLNANPPAPDNNVNTLTARNLTVAGSYADSTGSTVTLNKDAGGGGNAVFNGRANLHGTFTAQGAVTFNGGTADLPGEFNTIDGAFQAAGMTLGAGAKVLAQPTLLDLSGDIVLHSGAAGNVTQLNAGGLNLTGRPPDGDPPLNAVRMGDYSILGAQDITTSGDVDLSGGVNDNLLSAGGNLTVGGVYRDGAGSKTTVTGTTTFKGGKDAANVNVINGGFSTVDMTLEGGSKLLASGAPDKLDKLDVSGTLTLEDGGGDAPGGPAGGNWTVMDAAGRNLDHLAALRLGDKSGLITAGAVKTAGDVDLTHGTGNANTNILAAGSLDVGGIYKDAAGSIAEIAGTAVFSGTTAAHAIQGTFSSKGMTVGTDAVVDASNAAGFTSNGGDLILQAGSGNPGSGPADGVTTLNAGGHDLAYDNLYLKNNTGLAARDVIAAGNADLAFDSPALPDYNVNTLTARNLTVAGSYADSAGSVVTLTKDAGGAGGSAVFNGTANVNSLFTAEGPVAFYGGTALVPSEIAGAFTANGMTVGSGVAGAFVNVADYGNGKFNLGGGPLIVRAHSGLRGTGALDLRAGRNPVDIDLNRDPLVPAIQADSVTLHADGNPLTLRHSGTTPAAATWVLVQGEGENSVTGKLANPTIATASLQGALRQETDRILFTGAYTPLSSPQGMAFVPALRPNARRAASGFADLFDNRRTPFMHAMDAAYTSREGLQADLHKNLQGMTAEGALNQALHAQRMHDSVAASALGYAFGSDAPISAQGFVPGIQASFQEAGSLSSLSRTPRQAPALAGRSEFAGNGDLLLARQPVMPQGYSVLTAWRPASRRNAALAASAHPALGAEALGAGLNADYATSPGIKVWSGYIGNFSTQQAHGGYSGYSAEHHGFLLGASVNINELWTVGAYGGWSSGNTRSDGIRSEIDSGATHLGLFGRYRDTGGLSVTGDLAWSIITNDSRRHVPLAFGTQEMTASYNQQVLGFGLEAAYEWLPEADPATSVTPFLAARYSHLSQDAYSEKGNLPLKVRAIESDTLATTLGVRAARDFNLDETIVLTPRASAAWLHNWGDEYASARSSFVGSPVSFETRSVTPGRDAAQLGTGLDLRVKQDSWDFGLKTAYGVELRGTGADHTLYGGLEVKF